MNRLWYAAGSVLLCGAMAFAQDTATNNQNSSTTTATTTQTNNNGNVTQAPEGTTVKKTTRDTIVMPKKKVVHTKKNSVKGGGKKMAAAPADLGRGGKAIGHNAKGGHPVAAAKAGEKGGKDFGTTVGSGAKNAAIGVKDKVGHGLSAIGNKVEGKDKKAQTTTTTDQTTTTSNPK
jgi:hypothetical protein